MLATVLLAVLLLATAPAPGEVRVGVESFVTWSLRGNAVVPGTRWERTVRRVTEDGHTTLRAEAVWYDTTGRVDARTVSDADPVSLAPLRVRVRAARDSSALACTGGRVLGWAVSPNAPPRLFDEPAPPGLVAPELEDALVAAMPLGTGYTTRFDALGALGGVNRRVVTVAGADTVQAAGAVRDCWVVKLGTGRATDPTVTLWVDRTSRRAWQRRGDYGNFSWFHRATNP